MKSIAGAWFVALLVSTTAVSVSAQQTSYLRVAGLSPNPSGGAHAGELKLSAFENAGTNAATISVTYGGLRAGKVSFQT